MKKIRSLIEPGDFSKKEWEILLNLAEEITKDPDKYKHIADGKILATLFYEPSTRTRLSFDAAIKRLGGRVIGFSDVLSSSVTKGETLKDTAKIIEGYADIIAIRHPGEGAARVVRENTNIPIINAGDGGHNHPTQTIADLFTIKREKKRLDNLNIAICGDLKNGRTTHSLLKALSRYEGNTFTLISPEELRMPSQLVRGRLKEKNIEYKEVRKMDERLKNADILYMTRVQKERFDDINEYARLKDEYILNAEKLKLIGKDTLILHPLPRVNEISTEVDSDDRAAYFRQAKNGMYGRMALIILLLGLIKNDEFLTEVDDERKRKKEFAEEGSCPNKKCITNTEHYKERICKISSHGEKVCAYCDAIVR